MFRPSANWKRDAKEEAKGGGKDDLRDKLKDKKVKCRICNGEHFTARCPFKDTMAPVGESDVGAGGADGVLGIGDGPGEAAGGLGSGKSSYVPPHLRNGGATGGGDRMGGGKYERDDLATLRVTNVCFLPPPFLSEFILTCYLEGFRNGRRARTPRHVRALWSGNACFLGEGQRDGTSQGVRIH